MINNNNRNANYTVTFGGSFQFVCFAKGEQNKKCSKLSQDKEFWVVRGHFCFKFDYTILTSCCLNILNIIKETVFCIVQAEKKLEMITMRTTGDFLYYWPTAEKLILLSSTRVSLAKPSDYVVPFVFRLC